MTKLVQDAIIIHEKNYAFEDTQIEMLDEIYSDLYFIATDEEIEVKTLTEPNCDLIVTSKRLINEENGIFTFEKTEFGWRLNYE